MVRMVLPWWQQNANWSSTGKKGLPNAGDRRVDLEHVSDGLTALGAELVEPQAEIGGREA